MRLCPAVKSQGPPSNEPKRDPFLPPFDKLFVGEMRDELEDQEYYVLVSTTSRQCPLDPLHLTDGGSFLNFFSSTNLQSCEDISYSWPEVFSLHAALSWPASLTGNFLEYQPQSSPLTPADLVQTYLLLLAAQARRLPYFAFFNCGIQSGASQPHKHIQFLPTPEFNGPPIERLASATKVENEGKVNVFRLVWSPLTQFLFN